MRTRGEGAFVAAWCVLAVGMVVGCGGEAETDDDAGEPELVLDSKADQLAEDSRKARIHVPDGYAADPSPRPLVILLHGLWSNAEKIERYFKLTPLADELGFFLVRPNGKGGAWHATDACCSGTSDRDVKYLRGLIDLVASQYAIDPKRIHVMGHSNGGYMSHRMACDAADKLASVLSLAGQTWKDPNRCWNAEPISVAEVHATGDGIRRYDGNSFFNSKDPSVFHTTYQWADKNGCSSHQLNTIYPLLDLTTAGRDLRADEPGRESYVGRIDGCPAGIDVELWTINGASHQPTLTDEGRRAMVEFLLRHPKP